jgi:hypothetical protein
VQSNAFLAVERTLAYSRTIRAPANVRYASACERESLTEKQCSATFERTCRTCHIVASVRTNVHPTLECTSASCISIPEAVCIFLFLEILINC